MAERFSVRVDVIDRRSLAVVGRPPRAVVHSCHRIEVQVVRGPVPQQLVDERLGHFDEFHRRNRGADSFTEKPDELLSRHTATVPS